MENFRISAGILVIYFLMLTLGASGQAFTSPVFVRPGQTIHSAHQVDLVTKIYTSQIGVREKLNNSGKEVEQYLNYVNLSKGNPWCAAFVCWVYGRAGVANPRTGWSPGLFGERRVIWGRGLCAQCPPGAASEWLQPGGWVGGGFCTHVVPSTGDVFGLYFPEKGRIAHVGFIDEWKDPWVITVEGNTNVLGSREGDGVYRKRRLVRSIYKVARYVK